MFSLQTLTPDLMALEKNSSAILDVAPNFQLVTCLCITFAFHYGNTHHNNDLEKRLQALLLQISLIFFHVRRLQGKICFQACVKACKIKPDKGVTPAFAVLKLFQGVLIQYKTLDGSKVLKFLPSLLLPSNGHLEFCSP